MEGALEYLLHDLNEEQRQEKINQLHAAAVKEAETYAELRAQAGNTFIESASPGHASAAEELETQEQTQEQTQEDEPHARGRGGRRGGR